MKNLFYFLAFTFLLPIAAQANIYSGWHITEEDPCCIYFEFSDSKGDKDVINTLTVVIDGTITYNMWEGYENVHCFDGNGAHTINFYIDGELDRSETFEITGCEGDCSVCELTEIRFELDSLAPCRFWMDYRLITIDTIKGYSPLCDNPTAFWDFGDGTNSDTDPLGDGYYHDYAEDGTYNVCLTFTVTNPDGVECSISECTELVVEGCTPVDPCCGLELTGLNIFTHPLFPCRAFISTAAGTTYNTACGPVTYTWTIDGVTVPNNNSSRLTPAFNGDGVYQVCLTMSQENCEVTHCESVVIFGCPGFTDGGAGADFRSSDWEIITNIEMSIAPNPATDWINVNFPENVFSPIQEVSILSTNGQVLRSIIPTSNQVSVDVSEFPTGIYFVRVVDEMGMISTERFVKTK